MKPEQDSTVSTPSADPASVTENKASNAYQLVAIHKKDRELYDELYSFILSLGDDINVKELKLYIAFSRLRNFVCVRPMKGWLKLWLNIDPTGIAMEDGFSCDVSGKGHWGTGNLEISLHNLDGLEKAKSLIERAYQES